MKTVLVHNFSQNLQITFKILQYQVSLTSISKSGCSFGVALQDQKGQRCPTQVQALAFKMKITLVVSMYIVI
jgi:hypothetical protein